jgi:hypothetical protein
MLHDEVRDVLKEGYQANDASVSCRIVWNMDLMQICAPQIIDILRDEPVIVNANKSIHWRSRRVQDLGDGFIRRRLTRERDRPCRVPGAALNTSYLAKFPDTQFDQVAIRSR